MMYSVLYLCLIIIFMNTSAEITSRIYRGIDLRSNLHKYLVKLIKYYVKQSITICSGTILNEQWIISSAHCFPYDVIFVEVQKPGPILLPTLATVKKSQIFEYPGYEQNFTSIPNYEKDLALLKTTKRIKFNDKVQPVQLSRRSVPIGLTVTIAGYGKAEAGLPRPREGSTVVTKCRFSTKTTLICTHGPVRAGSGDSGGPLVSKEGLVGVTSCSCKEVEKKEDCVTGYVDVSINLDWIERVMASY